MSGLPDVLVAGKRAKAGPYSRLRRVPRGWYHRRRRPSFALFPRLTAEDAESNAEYAENNGRTRNTLRPLRSTLRPLRLRSLQGLAPRKKPPSSLWTRACGPARGATTFRPLTRRRVGLRRLASSPPLLCGGEGRQDHSRSRGNGRDPGWATVAGNTLPPVRRPAQRCRGAGACGGGARSSVRRSLLRRVFPRLSPSSPVDVCCWHPFYHAERRCLYPLNDGLNYHNASASRGTGLQRA